MRLIVFALFQDAESARLEAKVSCLQRSLMQLSTGNSSFFHTSQSTSMNSNPNPLPDMDLSSISNVLPLRTEGLMSQVEGNMGLLAEMGKVTAKESALGERMLNVSDPDNTLGNKHEMLGNYAEPKMQTQHPALPGVEGLSIVTAHSDPLSLQGMLQEVNQKMLTEQAHTVSGFNPQWQGLSSGSVPNVQPGTTTSQPATEKSSSLQSTSLLPTETVVAMKTSTGPQAKAHLDKARSRVATVASKAKATRGVDAYKKKAGAVRHKDKSAKAKSKVGSAEAKSSELHKLNESLAQGSDIRERLKVLMGKVNDMTVETLDVSDNELNDSSQSDNSVIPAMTLFPKKYSPDLPEKSPNVSSAIEHYEIASEFSVPPGGELQPQQLNFSTGSSSMTSQGQSSGGGS